MKKLFFILFISSMVYSQKETLSQVELDSLRTELETVFMKDQTFRRIYIEAEKKLGKDSAAYDYFWEVVEAQDKVFENQVTGIIDTFGWLGISQIGRLANTTLWIVLQHGSVASKEKYAPLLLASVKEKESQAIHYARLIDRMLINSDKPQLYGTQVNYEGEKPQFYLIKNAEKINKRRSEIGLGPIQDFAKSQNINWDIKQKK